MSEFMGSYDIRGKYPEQLDSENAYKIGKSIKNWKNPSKVLVVRDGRNESQKLKEALIDGMIDAGIKVKDGKLATTPVSRWACLHKDFDLALSITASHNPSGYTGIKFTDTDGKSIGYETGLNELESIIEKSHSIEGEGSVESVDIVSEYMEYWVSRFDHLDPQEIVVDYGNGVASITASRIFQRLGFEVKEINKEVDGEFPNHLPEPSQEVAEEFVEPELSDGQVGLIFDGDGDRCGFVMPEAGYLQPDTVSALFSKYLLEKEEGSVLFDVRTSEIARKTVQRNGGEVIDMRVGNTFFSQKVIEETDVVFGAEVSGHYFLPVKEAYYDDGLVAALTFVEMIQEEGFEDLMSSIPDYPPSPELRIDCPEDQKQKVVDRFKKRYSSQILSEKDGVRFELEGSSVLVRPSNTEPKLSVKVEAESKELVERITQRITGEIDEEIH